MNPLTLFRRPEYLFRPRQIWLRVWRRSRRSSARWETVTLPWGGSIQIDPREYIGSVIWHAPLVIGEDWSLNRGLARLAEGGTEDPGKRLEVPVATLDRILGPGKRVGVCKLDVEGHELNVLRGAARTLRQGRLRDLIFEVQAAYPSPVHEYLLGRGYKLFSLQGTLWRPLLRALPSASVHSADLRSTNFLATLDPERALNRFRPMGWQSLRRSADDPSPGPGFLARRFGAGPGSTGSDVPSPAGSRCAGDHRSTA